MIDALHNPQTVLLIGGNSDIGFGIINELVKLNRIKKVIVTGTNMNSLDIKYKNIRELNIDVIIVELNFEKMQNYNLKLKEIFENNYVDMCIVSTGYLPRNDLAIIDSNMAVKAASINFIGPMVSGIEALNGFSKQGKGTLIVLSTVAVEIPRKDIVIYGSTKIGLDYWARSMMKNILGTPIKIVLVKPGMVRTKMTENLKEVPFIVDVDYLARKIVKLYKQDKSIIWVPSILRYVIIIIRFLPRFISNRLFN
jgi:decaprenylphospho-beta-D-erythro-pentofuranosid-2-ulose 2-reductase